MSFKKRRVGGAMSCGEEFVVGNRAGNLRATVRKPMTLMAMVALIACATTCLLAQTAKSSPEQRGTRWRQEAKKAAESANASGEVSGVSALSQLHDDFPENSRAARNYAWAELRAGKPDAALQPLQQYGAMGMTLKPGGPIYDAFAKAGLIEKVPELAKNRTAITHAQRVFTFNDSGLLPEDIAFDTRSRRLLLTSARKKKIVSCDLTGECRDAVNSTAPQELDGMLAIHIDQKKNLLWATTSGMAMQEGFRPERKGKSALLKYDLTNFRLLKRYEPGDGREHALGDMTVASNGDAYVADGLSGDVYVVRSSTDKLKQLLPAGVFVSPQTPALNGDETILYVPDYVEGIAAIDLKSRKVTWVRISQPVALDGIDGLYWCLGALIATQNATPPERVVRFHLPRRNYH
jgi:sugar lactone lactonase YvrE